MFRQEAERQPDGSVNYGDLRLYLSVTGLEKPNHDYKVLIYNDRSFNKYTCTPSGSAT